MNEDPAKLSLSNFLAGESNDPLQAPASFTTWMRVGAWAVELYEPELLATADARTVINYGGKPRPVINLCSYNYLGLANHPEVLAAAHEALRTHGLGACGSPMLSGMTDLHRELERRVARFLGREDAMLFNSGFGGALGTIAKPTWLFSITARISAFAMERYFPDVARRNSSTTIRSHSIQH